MLLQNTLTSYGILTNIIALVGLTCMAERPINMDIKEARAGHVKICDEKFAAVSDLHTACLNPPRRAHEVLDQENNQGMTNQTKEVVLGIHNYYRSQVRAQDMQIMTWDHELAELAQRWASNCMYMHDYIENRVIPGRFSVGQNIAWTSLDDWKFTLEAWHEEHKYFRYGYGPALRGEDILVGHYTQMVWASSSKLGCGYAFCNGTRHFYVCNYGPVGNVALPSDEKAKYRPYKYGRRLSACPYYRRDGLCDCRGKVCLNGGTLDVTTCTCKCINRPWIDQKNDCALKCEYAEDNWVCKTWPRGIWGPSYCLNYTNVPYEYCPVMCRWCPAGGKRYYRKKQRRRLTTTPKPKPHHHRNHHGRFSKNKAKPKHFGENELPLGDQPHGVAPSGNSSAISSTTTTTTMTTISTTTTSSIATTTNAPNDVADPSLPPECLKTESAMCGQPKKTGYYPPQYCKTYPYVRLMCPAMCGTCSVKECIDHEGRHHPVGHKWLTAYGRLTCTPSGAKLTTGCVKDPGSPRGMFLQFGSSKVFRMGDYKLDCFCSLQKRLTCTHRWVGRRR